MLEDDEPEFENELTRSGRSVKLVPKKGVGKGHNQHLNDTHHNWKGAKASSKAKHNRIRRRLGDASSHPCCCCAEDDVDRKSRYWARIHTESGEDPWGDYIALCAPCHEHYDYNEKHPETVVKFTLCSHKRRTKESSPPTFHKRDECSDGHPITDETAWYHQRPGGSIRTICKICKALDPCQRYSGTQLPDWAKEVIRNETLRISDSGS